MGLGVLAQPGRARLVDERRALQVTGQDAVTLVHGAGDDLVEQAGERRRQDADRPRHKNGAMPRITVFLDSLHGRGQGVAQQGVAVAARDHLLEPRVRHSLVSAQEDAD